MQIVIPFKTPTVNNMYVTFTPKGGRRTMRIKSKESKAAAEDVKEIILNGPFKKIEGPLRVDMEIYSNWHNKDGSIKKRDIANLEKFITDSIFSNIEGMDDSQIFQLSMIKMQSDKEEAVINIEALE